MGKFVDFAIPRNILPTWAEKQGLTLKHLVPADFAQNLGKKLGLEPKHKLVVLCNVLALEYGLTEDQLIQIVELICDQMNVNILQVNIDCIDDQLTRLSLKNAKDFAVQSWVRRSANNCSKTAIHVESFLEKFVKKDADLLHKIMQYFVLIIEAVSRPSKITCLPIGKIEKENDHGSTK